MDVRCTKCGIEYEFDDAKVTAAGVTVKCTSCGHVFKVKREEPSLPSPPTTGSFRVDGEWMVRQGGGTIYRFKELTTLQKWIVERKVSREDEISKTGKTWKRLGDVAELASFFQVVDAATAALQASVVAVQPAMASSMPGMGPGAAGVSAIRLPNTDSGFGGRPMPQPTPAGTPVTAAVSAAGLDAAAPAPAAPAVPVRPAPRSAPTDGIDALDDDDPVLAWQKSKRRRLVAATLILVVAAVVAVGFTFRARLMEAMGGGASASLAPTTVEAARGALRADRASARAAVRPDLDAAASTPDAPPAALAWQARFDIAAAAEQHELARLHSALAALAAPGSADAAKHETAAKEANDAADAALAGAYRAVGDVRTRAPALPDGHLAGAAYQLEKGGLAEARGDLEAARKATAPDALAAMDAEIGVQQALADARAALGSADASALAAAADRIPQSDDGRLLGVRASLRVLALARQAAAKAPVAVADLDAARALVSALPAPDERAALLLALLAALTEAGKPPDAPAAPLDAGPALAVDAGTAVAVSGGAAPDAGTAAAAVDDGAHDSYDVVMQKAERARVNGKSRQAHELFVKATKLKPSAPRPWLGVGWAAMDLGRNTESLRAFKRAVDLSPDIGEAHFGLAEAYRFTGDNAAAVAEYQEFLRLDPRSRDAEVARRAIESLKE